MSSLLSAAGRARPFSASSGSSLISANAKRIRRTVVGSASSVNLSQEVADAASVPVVIGTHHGTFHCDEALAVGLLKSLPEYEGAAVLRTRNLSELEQCHIVVDVGAVYDAEKKRFDHHQRGFFETFDAEHKTKLSSAGLVYKHYGKEIIAHHAGVMTNSSLADDDLEEVYQRMYDGFIEHIDGIDNGVESTRVSATTE